MTALIDRNRGKGVGIVGIVALAVWFVLCAGPVRAQVAPLPPQEEPDDDPPRKDVRMGNTENMRMGRDAEGNVVMEVRAPKKNSASQPQVGPFFIYPQVGMPPMPGGGPGGQSGSQMGGQTSGSGMSQGGARGQGTGMSGQTMSSGQMGQTGAMGQSGQMGQTGQMGQGGQGGSMGMPGQTGFGGQTGQSIPVQSAPATTGTGS